MNTRNRVYQFKISLRDITPFVWRRIQVPTDYSFWDLHVAIQDSMGWLDYHLHQFSIKRPHARKMAEIGIPDPEGFCPPEDCGGVYGYFDFLEAVLNPTHEEHERMIEWYGKKYDPNDFSPESVRFDNPKRRWKMAFQSR